MTKFIPSRSEADLLGEFARDFKRARLRRNLTQTEMAERIGASRDTVLALEKGRGGVSIGFLLRAMSVFGYGERVGELISADPIGADIEQTSGRQRARNHNVADF